MKAKSKKWAAESLVSETEKKAIPTPKQQREAGEVTLGMVSAAMSPVGSKKVDAVVDKIVGKVVRKAKKTTKASKKAADKAVKKIKAVVDKYGDPPDTIQGDIDFAKSRGLIVGTAGGTYLGAKYFHERDKKKKTTKKPSEMAKGGYAKKKKKKKYANGGSVRSARF